MLFRSEELRAILDQVRLDGKMGVCLDTCHVWDAGYDIVNDLDGVLDTFDHIIGLGSSLRKWCKPLMPAEEAKAVGGHPDIYSSRTLRATQKFCLEEGKKDPVSQLPACRFLLC